MPQPYRRRACVRAAVGYLRGLPLVPFEVAANAPGRGLLDVEPVVWLLLRMQISFQHSSSQRKEPGGGLPAYRNRRLDLWNSRPLMGTQFNRITDGFQAQWDSYAQLQSPPAPQIDAPRPGRHEAHSPLTSGILSEGLFSIVLIIQWLRYGLGRMC
jgi:hypothetical protein